MFLHFLKKLDWMLMVSVFLLVAMGLLSIFSTTFYHEKSFFIKQAIFLVVGFFLMILFAALDYRYFRNHPTLLLALYFISVILLAAVLFLGKGVRGATSWFNFGLINFEPVELAKLVMILILAQYFSLRHIELYRLIHIVISGIYTFVVAGLVFFQPDLGSAAVLIFLWLGVMLVAGIKFRQLIILFLIGLIIFSIAWMVILKPYQKQRITSFINPYLDPKGSGYHRIQSMIAIGSGKFLGRGLGQGSQSQLDFLPEQHTDFIFASIAEEMGFVGVVLIFIFYFIFFFRIVKTALIASNNFGRLFCIGAAIVFIFQVFVNIGMNLGLLPITGISLPFISYGGSNLLISFVMLGIVQSINVREK